MSIQEFAKLQAEMPTPELIEKARVWIELMNKIGIAPCSKKNKTVNDPDMVLGEVCRRLDELESFNNFNLINSAQTLLDNLEETHAALCFTPDYIGSLRYEQNKAAINKAKGLQQ